MTSKASQDGIQAPSVSEPAQEPNNQQRAEESSLNDEAAYATFLARVNMGSDVPMPTKVPETTPTPSVGFPDPSLMSLPSEHISHAAFFTNQLQNWRHGFSLALEALVAERNGRDEKFKTAVAEMTAKHEAERATLTRRIDDMRDALAAAERGIGEKME